MSRVGVHKDHQVIGEPRVLHRGVPQASRNGLGTFQHPIYLGEIDVAEQRRDHAMYAKGNFEFERHIALCRTLSILDLRRKR
jgi:hypothetical protein